MKLFYHSAVTYFKDRGKDSRLALNTQPQRVASPERVTTKLPDGVFEFQSLPDRVQLASYRPERASGSSIKPVLNGKTR